MLSINTNISSQIVQQSMANATKLLNLSIEQMTTGSKLNHAKDNAANYSISTNMSTKLSAYQIAEDNTLQGLDMLTTASDSLSLIETKLSRLRALQEQAMNGTYGRESLKAVNAEANAIVDEINRLYKTTSYNGIDLFEGKINDPTMPVAGENGFIAEVVKDTPEVIVSDPTKLEEAINNNSIIGISNAETLAELATIVNDGNNCSGKTIVLTNDIDLGDWCADHSSEGGWTPIGDGRNPFSGTFNGNGYTISNLFINRPEDCHGGLFGLIENSKITNLCLKNTNITETNAGGLADASGESDITNCFVSGLQIYVNDGCDVGGLLGSCVYTNIENCYATGSIKPLKTTCSADYIGGLVGNVSDDTIIKNCFADVDIVGNYDIGGLVGCLDIGKIINSYALGDVKGEIVVGGLVGKCYDEVCNSSSFGKVSGDDIEVGAFIGCTYGVPVTNCTYYSSINPDLDAIGKDSVGITSDMLVDKIDSPFDVKIGMQVGINSGDSSRIGLETSFSLGSFEILRGIGINKNIDYLSKIDELLETVSAKQTEYGAAQNRLMSALEEISTQSQNLVSSRSTLRDADIAEVSSTYIQQQILQEAAATLMSTANQTPAIALQLL